MRVSITSTVNIAHTTGTAVYFFPYFTVSKVEIDAMLSVCPDGNEYVVSGVPIYRTFSGYALKGRSRLNPSFKKLVIATPSMYTLKNLYA